MTDEFDEEPGSGLDRRTALKRIGAAAALTWAAPAVLTLSAANAATPAASCASCSTNACGGDPTCGTYSDIDADGCFCSSGPTGCVHVFFPSSNCGDYGACGPAPGYSCPPGFTCTTTCCCTAFCAPICGVGPQSAGSGALRPPGA